MAYHNYVANNGYYINLNGPDKPYFPKDTNNATQRFYNYYEKTLINNYVSLTTGSCKAVVGYKLVIVLNTSFEAPAIIEGKKTPVGRKFFVCLKGKEAYGVITPNTNAKDSLLYKVYSDGSAKLITASTLFEKHQKLFISLEAEEIRDLASTSKDDRISALVLHISNKDNFVLTGDSNDLTYEGELDYRYDYSSDTNYYKSKPAPKPKPIVKPKVKAKPSVSNFKINIPIHNNKGLGLGKNLLSFVVNFNVRRYKIYAETKDGSNMEISSAQFWDSISGKTRIRLLIDVDEDVVVCSEDYESLVLTIPANQLNQSFSKLNSFATKSGRMVDVLRYEGEVDVIEKDEEKVSEELLW